MRRLLPLLFAALAACQVDVEGAPCGGAQDCPAGQGCGVDQRCSTLAATCALQTVGARTRDCEQDGLVCGARSGAPSCECPAPVAAEFAVAAPGSSSPREGLVPTGAAEPPECRFRSLGAGITAAAGAGGGTVVAMGAAAGQASFGAATNELLPVDVPAGVTLTTDRSPGATYAIRLDDQGASAAVRLHAGAVLSGFIIENAAGDSQDAVELACDGTNVPVRLDRVEVRGTSEDAQHQLKRGIVVTDTCGVEGTEVVVTGMQEEALFIEAKHPAVESTFTGGAFQDSGKAGTTEAAPRAAVSLKQGVLKLDGVRVERNEAYGIEAGSSSKDTELDLSSVRVLGNGDTGIVVVNNGRLFIADVTVYGNGAQTMWGLPPFTASYARLCGGIVLRGDPPPDFRFERNRVYRNAGDQALVLTSGEAWDLSGGECPAPGSSSMSVFGCYDGETAPPPSTVSYRGVVAIDAKAVVRNVAWRLGRTPPSSTIDFRPYGTGASVDVGDPALYCPLPAELDCDSPDPK